MKALWVLFILGQFLSAGHINYQQEQGYYEINPLYGRHPSKSRVYATKAVETIFVYKATKIWPQHEKKILAFANTVVVGFFVYDGVTGVKFGFRF